MAKTKNKNHHKWIKKRTEELIRHFPKKDIKVAKRNKKRCSISVSIRKTQIKTMRYHLATLARMAIIKKTRATSDIKVSDNEYLWQWRTMGTHAHAGQSVNLSSVLDSSLVESTKETYPAIQQFHCLRNWSYQETLTRVFNGTAMSKSWTPSKRPSTGEQLTKPDVVVPMDTM